MRGIKRTVLTFGAGSDEERCKYEMMERMRGENEERETKKRAKERMRVRERERERERGRKRVTE